MVTLTGAVVVASAGNTDAQGRADNPIADVEDIIAEVESLDGAESESKQGRTVTVGITSDVLFRLDTAKLSPKAKARLTKVAEKIESESADGPVKVEGHTDDQGHEAYNDKLSLRRAEAVRLEMESLLPGRHLGVKGFGESKPKLPNIVEGTPVEKNRAGNRRVEIIFDIEK